MLPAPGSATERPLPAWAAGQPRAALQALLLLGTWDPVAQSTEDESLLGLLGCDAPTLTALCQVGQQAGVLRLEQKRRLRSGTSGQSWYWADAAASWRTLAPLLDGSACERFAQVCTAILRGQGSPRRRSGIVLSLARLGNSDGLIAVEPRPSQRAAQLVQTALPPVPTRWHDLADLLTRLAEAAPEAFLACVEGTVSPPAGTAAIWPELANSEQVSDEQAKAQLTIFAISRALGLLALDVSLLPQVTLLLARLAAYCQPSKPNQRTGHPIHTLEEIFDLRWPKTNATIEERLNALEPLLQVEPSVAWDLFFRLLVDDGAVELAVPRPVAMRLSIPSEQRAVSVSAIYSQEVALLGWVLALAGCDGKRWAALVQLKAHLYSDLFLSILRSLRKRDLSQLTNRSMLWNAVRESLHEFSPADEEKREPERLGPAGVPPRERQIEELSRSLYQRLSPSDFVESNAWLFSKHPRLPIRYASFEEHHAQLKRAQASTADELCSRDDRWERLLELAERTEDSQRLAELLAQSAWGEELEREWVRLRHERPNFVIRFLAWRAFRQGMASLIVWIQRLSRDSHPEDAAKLAALVTGGIDAEQQMHLWDALDSIGEPTVTTYWQLVDVHQLPRPLAQREMARVLTRLMDAARWEDARTVVMSFKGRTTAMQCLELLRRAREALSPNAKFSLGRHGDWESLWLHIQPESPTELAYAQEEEAAWLGLLSEQQYQLRFLPELLRVKPAQFVAIAQSREARNLQYLWRGWPGDKLPVEQSQHFLYQWTKAVIQIAQGQPFEEAVHWCLAPVISRPMGTDGLWPGHALRQLLEEEHTQGRELLAAAVLRNGRESSVRIRRVGTRATENLQLAEDCERSALKLASGWPTVADICRQLAAMYRQDAEDWKEREAMWNESDGPVGPLPALQPMFPLTELQVENFRGVTHATLHPLHPRLNIFYGRNASGKTTLLDALRIGLRRLVNKLPPNFHERENESDLPSILNRDRHRDAASQKDAPQVRITLSGGRHRDEPLTWVVERNYARGTEANDRETAAVAEYFEALSARLGHGDLEAPLPVFAFYGAGRLPSTKAETAVLPRDEARTRADGLRFALDQVTRFEQGTVWFTQEWVSDLQAGPGNEGPTLSALRQALDATLLTPEGMGIKNPHLKKKTQVLAVDFVRPGQSTLELELGQLSDGFRTLFALVTDLLRRIVECNPARDRETDPATRWRNTPAVVLIDEIDAHLHPSWQKTVLSGLIKAFPCAQFFVTTHSPLVLGAERDATIWELEDGKVSPVGQLYGKTPDVLLQDYLETELRPKALQDKLDEASALLDRGEFAQAAARIEAIEEDDQLEPDRPELVKLRTRLALMQERATRIAAKKQAT